jgi:hypothetical protein
VSPNGEVASVRASSNTGLSDSVVKCISRAFSDANFKPSPAGSTLEVPVRFVKAQ